MKTPDSELMSRKHYIAIAGLVLVASGSIFWLANRNNNIIQGIENALVVDRDFKEKADNPLKYAQLYNELRTRPSESKPGYPMGYQQEELEKARQKTVTARLNSTYNFIERGPANVSGRTRALLVDPDDLEHNTYLAGSVGGGIWKTTNGGASWINKTSNMPNLAISWMVMAESDHDIIYAGTGESIGAYIGIRGTGIYKSIDRGETWNLLSSTAQHEDFQMVNRIIIDPVNSDIVLVATSNDHTNGTGFRSAIYKSVDGGVSWTSKFIASDWVQQLVATPGDFNTLFATVHEKGVYKSLDGGETWIYASADIVPDGRIEMAVSPVNTNRLFASVEGNISGDRSDLYVSDDAGDTWWLTTEETTGIDVDFLGGQGGYDNTIAAHPFNQDMVYVGGVNLWKFEVIPSTVIKNQFKTAIEDNTRFLSLQSFNGAEYYGSRIDVGDESVEDFVSVEMRFGPDGEGGYLKQYAHRFTVPDGRGSGVSAIDYSYQDYVEVPFQVWDITNNRQLMVSFRDQQKDGVFNLVPHQINNDLWEENSREYIFISNIDYNGSTPDPNIGTDGQHEARLLYNLWPYLTYGETWDESNLPESSFTILYEDVEKRERVTTSIADAYNEFDGVNHFYQSIGSSLPEGVHPDHHNIVPIIWDEGAQTFQLLIANDGGVYKSDVSASPGEADITWSHASMTYNTSQFYSVDKAPSESRYLGGLQDNGTWMTSPGSAGSENASYRRAGDGDGFGCVWNHENPQQMLISLYFNNIRRSTNGGSSFTPVNGIGDAGGELAPFVTEIENAHSDPDVVYVAGARGVWRSTDFGKSWKLGPINDKFYNKNLPFFSSTAKIRISNANSHIIWAGTSMQESTQKISLHVSTDEGVTFNSVNNYTDRELGKMSGMATHPILDSTAFVLFSFAEGPKVLRTDDLGQSWRDISGFGANTSSSNGFPDVALYDLLVMPQDTSIIWAGTDIGIVESTDAGETWHLLNSNMPAVSIWDMKIIDNEVVIGTHGRGIWSVTLDDLPGHVYLPVITGSLPTLTNEHIVNIDMKSKFDSTLLYLNGLLYSKLNEPTDIGRLKLYTNYSSYQTVTAHVRSFYRGVPYVSHVTELEPIKFEDPIDSYENNFELTFNDFIGHGFTESEYYGFENKALHSEHNYNSNAEYEYILKSPITVRSSNALMNFDEVVLVETGLGGVLPGTPDFHDYVVVQGSVDGINWTNLLDEYDASARETWLTAYDNLTTGASSLYKFRSIDLLETFQPGDEVLIRFLLVSDDENNNWGWAIDNLRIQTPGVITGIEIEEGNRYSVYPNPVVSNYLTIVSKPTYDSYFHVFDTNGKLIFTKTLDNSGTTFVDIPWHLENGLYILSISAGPYTETHKILVNRR